MSGTNKSWTVFVSVEDEDHRCVDFFSRPNGSFGFEEFRRDPEDAGRWTSTHTFSSGVYLSPAQTLEAAEHSVPWLTETLKQKAFLREQIYSSAP
jgi:hypothetical protein